MFERPLTKKKRRQVRKRNPLPVTKREDWSDTKFWYRGERITKAAHDKLHWVETHIENNQIWK